MADHITHFGPVGGNGKNNSNSGEKAPPGAEDIKLHLDKLNWDAPPTEPSSEITEAHAILTARDINSDWGELCTEIVKCLKGNKQVFIYGGGLAKVVTGPLPPELLKTTDKDGKVVIQSKPVTATYIKPITKPHQILSEIEKVMTFKIWNKGKNSHVKARVTTEIGKHVIENGGDAGNGVVLPPLRAVVSHPVIDINGELVTSRQGYDDVTGIYYKLDEAITKEDLFDGDDGLRLAWLVLRNWLSEFEWLDSEKDFRRAVAIALTIMTRKTLYQEEGAPCIFALAPLSGSGKTHLMRGIHILVVGTEVPCTNFPNKEDEFEKTFNSLAMIGPPMILFDNVPRTHMVRASCVENYTTSAFYQLRTLGASEVKTVAAQSVIAFTGNNISPGGDLPNRTLEINIAPKTDQPALRDFKNDPIAYAKKYRSVLIRALHKIYAHRKPAEAVIVDGEIVEQGDIIVKGRMKGWSEHVGQAVQNGCNEKLFTVWEEPAEEEGTKTEQIEALCVRMNKVAELAKHGRLGEDGKKLLKGADHGMTYSEIKDHCSEELKVLLTFKLNDIDDTVEKALERLAPNNLSKKLTPFILTPANGWRLRKKDIGFKKNGDKIPGLFAEKLQLEEKNNEK